MVPQRSVTAPAIGTIDLDGVPSITPKVDAKLLEVLNGSDGKSLKANEADARLSQKLVTLDADADEFTELALDLDTQW